MAYDFTRRGLIGIGMAAASLAVMSPAEAAVRALSARGAPRALNLLNTHTGECFAGTYWADGGYVPGALGEISKVLRDHRTGDRHDMDVRLLDLLTALRSTLDTHEPFNVISGYRSPKTNRILAASSHGVARRSLHMAGQAMDIRVPGRDLRLVQRAALALKQGGVGYYPASDFVHVDVGRVRRWEQVKRA